MNWKISILPEILGLYPVILLYNLPMPIKAQAEIADMHTFVCDIHSLRE